MGTPRSFENSCCRSQMVSHAGYEPSNSDIVDYEEGSKDVFVIKNVMDFTHLILPRYYKIDRLQTYYNHLERYGFKRLCESPPKWRHEKWDKNNKDCLNLVYMIQAIFVVFIPFFMTPFWRAFT